ncbi:hypothetical protein NOV72_02667 [Caballeronia novacaledonica]|uniref:Uncharacterized protein n=1 Tax=Caballeronia novacaledonica TaxID=1544861 RepID=A0A2U3I5R2_9BURK|nr:hypothetical protein NOV72_02667 [Caballeronia novacaledonica]
MRLVDSLVSATSMEVITMIDPITTAATSTNIVHSDIFKQNAANGTNDTARKIGIRSVGTNPTASRQLRKAWPIEFETNIWHLARNAACED